MKRRESVVATPTLLATLALPPPAEPGSLLIRSLLPHYPACFARDFVSQFRIILKFRDENRRASTKNFLHGSEIRRPNVREAKVFHFSLAVFSAPLKNRALACLCTRSERTREFGLERSIAEVCFQGYCVRRTSIAKKKFSVEGIASFTMQRL